MTTEEKLKELILTKYNSLREFTLTIDIAYSTFDSIMRRGIQNATINNVLKICSALHISADALANGEIVPISPTETKSKPRDVADILARTKRELLNNDGLMFNGKVADPDSIESILNAMEIGIEMAKRKNKK